MNKRKLMLVAVALCMVAILGFGGTLAYLTADDAQVNTFVTGKVQIKLDEVIAEKDMDPESPTYGDFLPTGGRTEEDQWYGTEDGDKVFPGNDITKDPTITLLDGSEDSWIAAKIVVEGNLLPLIECDGEDAKGYLDITKIVRGGLVAEGAGIVPFNGLNPTHYANGAFIYQKPISDTKWELYIFMENTTAATEKIVLFDTITIPTEWNNDEMEKFNATKITINAYAVQADGFVDCFTAMTTAYDADFAF